MLKRAWNGGFPEPAADQPVRLVSARHETCGRETRVRLPGVVPARAVRRVVCWRCREPFECEHVRELDVRGREPMTSVAAVEAAERLETRPNPISPSLSDGQIGFEEKRRTPSGRPPGRAWRLASVPLAAVAVIAALLLIQGSDGPPAPAPALPAASAPPAGAGNAGRAARQADAELVRGQSFTIALPAGWERADAPSGAAFAALAPGAAADATLWVERQPNLDFAEFERRSLAQLEAIAGSAQVVERVSAPTPDATIVHLAADSPPGEPSYEVTLRSAGDYRYYLATTVEADAPGATFDGAELLHNSLVPEAGGAG